MEETSLSDKELIRRYQTGDAEAFGELYDRYIEKIYRFLYYKTHQREVAKDLASHVFTKALRAAQRFYEQEGGTVQAWLFRIARNAVIDYYRTQKQHLSVDDAWGVSAAEDIERDAANKEMLEQVREYMQELPAEQRDVIMLRLWEELSYEEIARITGKSEAACRMAFSRALRTLRNKKGDILLLLIAALIVP